jgi:carboxyl-terminal processing protease
MERRLRTPSPRPPPPPLWWPALLAALLLAAPAAARAAAQTPPAARSAPAADSAWIAPELRQQVSRAVCSEVQDHFAHWEAVPALRRDFDARCAAYRERALATTDRREFGLLTMELLAELRNGHTSYWDTWLNRAYGRPLGFMAAPFDGRWVVTRSALPAPRPGDVLEAIDGTAIADFVAGRLRYISASSRREAEHRLFARPVLFPERFTLALAGGEQVVIERSGAAQPPTAARPAAPASAAENDTGRAPPPAQPPPAVPARWLEEGRVAYMRIPSFGEDRFEAAALDRLREFRRAPALVVDLRGNGGGDTPWRLRKALAAGSYRTWEIVAESGAVRPGLLTRALTPLAMALARVPEYDGELVLLVDAGCGSACEDLVVSLKDAGRATLVGDTTTGSTGQPVVRTFEGGIGFRVGARRVAFPDGRPFEGVGIAPDVVVRPAPDDLRAGRDPVLERGLAVARERLGG